MQHLTSEALARLVDETPDRGEAAHLEACPACREELEALRRQTAALAALAEAPPAEPPPEHWQAIVAGLAAAAVPDDLAVRRRGGLTRTPWFRVAAAVALYALGTATGLELRARATPGSQKAQVAPSVATPATGAPATTTMAGANPPLAGGANPAGGQASTASEPASAPPRDDPGAGRLVADNTAPAGRLHLLDDPAQARTPAEALRFVREAERAYAQAYARYTELADPQQVDDPVARIAALESIVLTTRQALDRAPADPVINGYHLTAVAQRDAALRQVALRSDGRWF